MARKSGRQPMMAEINVVPYIDVMLVLLVIFMITAPLLTQGVQVNVPSVESKMLPSKEKEPIIVSVDAKGKCFLNINRNPQSEVTLEFLKHRVAEELKGSQNQGVPRIVLVKGDKTVDYGQVVQVMALLQSAGATQIGLITQPASQKG